MSVKFFPIVLIILDICASLVYAYNYDWRLATY